MDINRMTQKSQEALQLAQNIAIQHGHQEISSEHMLAALLMNETVWFPDCSTTSTSLCQRCATFTAGDQQICPRVQGRE